jgi:hypothetical protein
VRRLSQFPRTSAVVLASALGVVIGASSGSRDVSESKKLETVTTLNGAGHLMLTSPQALEVGYSALKNQPDHDKPGDIVVELRGTAYRVRFFFVVSGDRKLDHLIEVLVDAQSGMALKTEDKGRVAGLEGRSADKGWEKFLSSKQAYDLAVGAMKGFEGYDKQGRLTTELRKDIYYVTFPVRPPKQPGSEGADYAMQVLIDARSGKVLELLIAS